MRSAFSKVRDNFESNNDINSVTNPDGLLQRETLAI